MKALYAGVLYVALASCATTVDIERQVSPQTGAERAADGPAVIAVPIDTGPPEVIIVERPVFVPEGTPEAAEPAPKGRSAVQAANREGTLQPQDYSKGAMVYDFDPDWVYEIYTQPLRATDICLEPGERAWERPFVSDSERWMLGAAASLEGGREVQHVYVKPTSANIQATLIINTDRRVYHIILKSFTDVYMPIVRWRYPAPNSGLPFTIVPPSGAPAGGGVPSDARSLDPRFLSFNYKITYGRFNRPRWLPTLVYDDGGKTYIVFPEDVLQTELPAVFENRNDAVNYRVLENIIIIDKLIEKITVKQGNREIVIEKKT
jgi:type IV secretion system protein VirB9